jgi:hypothetical protein
MEREPHPYQTELTGIHINLEERAIEFEDRHGTVGRLVFTSETVLYEGRPLLLTPTDQRDRPRQQPAPPATNQPERSDSPPPHLSHNP